MTKDGVPAETGRVSKRQTIKRNNSKEYSTGIKNERRTTIRQYPANNSKTVNCRIMYTLNKGHMGAAILSFVGGGCLPPLEVENLLVLWEPKI